MTDSERLIELLTQSQYTTVLTGAGVSTESGIPDFRSPETGLWSKMDPMELFSRQVLELTPDVFWQRAEPLFREFASAQPNACHRALARLEQAGIIGGVVTQNIDGLHQMAGSKRVLEVHGHLRSGSCRKCCQQKSMEVLLEQVRKGESPPRCNCGGVFRPDVVLFGDPLPEEFEQAWQWVINSDLLLVVGSSLEVAPVCWLAERSRQLAIVNMAPTGYDYRADTVVQGQAGEVMQAIADHLCP